MPLEFEVTFDHEARSFVETVVSQFPAQQHGDELWCCYSAGNHQGAESGEPCFVLSSEKARTWRVAFSYGNPRLIRNVVDGVNLVAGVALRLGGRIREVTDGWELTEESFPTYFGRNSTWLRGQAQTMRHAQSNAAAFEAGLELPVGGADLVSEFLLLTVDVPTLPSARLESLLRAAVDDDTIVEALEHTVGPATAGAFEFAKPSGPLCKALLVPPHTPSNSTDVPVVLLWPVHFRTRVAFSERAAMVLRLADALVRDGHGPARHQGERVEGTRRRSLEAACASTGSACFKLLASPAARAPGI